MKYTTNILQVLLLLLITYTLVACSVVYPPNTPIKQVYVHVDNNNHYKCNTALHHSLQVANVNAYEPFNVKYMYYSDTPYELNHYTLHEWSTTPSAMLTSLIQERLLQSCVFGPIVGANAMATTKYRLNAQLINMIQVMHIVKSKATNDKLAYSDATIQLDILVLLIDNSNNKVIASKLFSIRHNTMANINGYTMGFNAAITDFLNNLLPWLDKATRLS